MHVGKKTLKREKSAMSLSLYGSLVFAIVEIGMAVFSGSQAVLLDAVYDSVEFFMMLPSIFLIPLLYRPSSEQHPFGYTQIETGFVVVKGAIMAAVTFGLIFNNIHLLLHGGHKVSFHTISAFELFACLLSLTVAICLYFKNKHMSSPLVNIELQTWKIDCVVSLGMAVAFLLPIIVPFAWFQRLTPYLDQIITIILSAFMLPTPIKTVITGLRDLMLWRPLMISKPLWNQSLAAMGIKTCITTLSVPVEDSGSVYTSPLIKTLSHCQNSKSCKQNALLP